MAEAQFASPRKRTNKRSFRYVRFVPIVVLGLRFRADAIWRVITALYVPSSPR